MGKIDIANGPSLPSARCSRGKSKQSVIKNKKRNPTRSAESYAIIGARDENRTRTGMNPEGF